jgi:hypothetical protein
MMFVDSADSKVRVGFLKRFLYYGLGLPLLLIFFGPL